MRICVTGGRGMVGSCIKDIINQYPEHEFVFLHRDVGRHGVELTSKTCVLTYFSVVLRILAHFNVFSREGTGGGVGRAHVGGG